MKQNDQLPVGLLLRAALAAELSSKVYDLDTVRSKLSATLRIPVAFAPLGTNRLEAVLVYCTPRPDAVQYGIWQVQQVGLVVAFKGSSSVRDYIVDAMFAPKNVSGSEWSAHGRIMKGVQQKRVMTASGSTAKLG